MVKLNIGRFIRFLIIFGLIFYFVFNLISGSLFAEELSYKLAYDKLDIQKTYKSVIFRNETVVYSNTAGNIKYTVTEGERVKKGSKIAEIYYNDAVAYDISVEKMDGQTETVATIDLEQLDTEIHQIYDEMLHGINGGNYSEVASLKEDLELKIDKKKKVETNKYDGKSESSLNTSYVGGGSLSEGEAISLYSPVSGIVTFYVDNYEEVFTLENIYNIDYGNILETNINMNAISGNTINAGSPVYKVIDNTSWAMVSIIDKSDMQYYTVGEKLTVEINGERLTGTVVDVFENDDQGALVMKFNNQFADFHKYRMVEATVINENYQGLKVEKDSIVNVDGVAGVYTLSIDNKATFVPISIIGYNETYAVVEDDFFYKSDGEESVRVKTLSLFDEVLRDGNLYNEGDKVY